MVQRHIEGGSTTPEPPRRFGEIRLDDKTRIAVEVIAGGGGGAAAPAPGAAGNIYEGSATLTGFDDTMRQLGQTVLTLSEAFKDTLSRVSTDECTVEFSIGFKGEARIIPVLLSGSSEGALKVVMKWKK